MFGIFFGTNNMASSKYSRSIAYIYPVYLIGWTPSNRVGHLLRVFQTLYLLYSNRFCVIFAEDWFDFQ